MSAGNGASCRCHGRQLTLGREFSELGFSDKSSPTLLLALVETDVGIVKRSGALGGPPLNTAKQAKNHEVNLFYALRYYYVGPMRCGPWSAGWVYHPI